MRLCWLLIACLSLALPGAAQIDSFALRSKYGPPLNRETFHLPQGFDLVVDYGVSHQVCRLEVPALMPSDEKVSNTEVMRARMYGFLADLVPAAMRGRELRRQTMMVGAISVAMTEYEHVTISELLSGSSNTITVTFTNGDCSRP